MGKKRSLIDTGGRGQNKKVKLSGSIFPGRSDERMNFSENSVKKHAKKSSLKHKSRHKKKKRKKHYSESSSSDECSSSDSTSSSSGSSTECEKKKHRTKKKKHRLHKSKERKTNAVKVEGPSESIEEPCIGPLPPENVNEKARSMAPMTKEEWEKRQSIVRKVYDEETGRHRLIKGDGEVLEEIVSRDRHKEINRLATKGDGAFFESSIQNKIKQITRRDV